MGDGQSIFCVGATYGLFIAILFGGISRQIRDNRTKMKAQYRPLDTFPDAAQPNLTPKGIVRSSLWGTLGCIFWIGVFGGALFVVYALTVFLMDIFP